MPTFIENKKVGLNYEIIETYEAGVELLGLEVKSLREKHGSLAGAYIIVRHGEVFLLNAHIPPYQEKNTAATYDPYRERKILLKKSEISALASQGNKNGLTIVPISMYSKGPKIKVEVAVVHGKKKHDKRETLKKRQTDRDIARKWNTR
jgi:SsrA-binding protein